MKRLTFYVTFLDVRRRFFVSFFYYSRLVKLYRHFSFINETSTINLSDQQINAYVETGEPLEKAGGHSIQGKANLFTHTNPHF